jgi:hypothetical protein
MVIRMLKSMSPLSSLKGDCYDSELDRAVIYKKIKKIGDIRNGGNNE